MSAALARNWWAIGLRALLAVAFVIAVLLLPRPTLGALVLMFAAYMAADGALAIVSGLRAMRRGDLWQTLVFEGATNLALVGAVLIWPAIAVSGVWGALAATVGPSSGSAPETMGWWLIGYSLPFAAILLVLAGLLQRRNKQSSAPISDNA
jgi:uncharacterized membrane protein HdeD (DUF308 family)